MILKSAVEHMIRQGRSLWVCFVDLEKAYDRIQRNVLWEVLEQELDVP